MPPRTTNLTPHRRTPKGSAFAMEIPAAVGRLSSAAAQRIADLDPKMLKRAEWQKDAYGFVEAIWTLGYVFGVTADAVARGKLKIVERDPETGRIVPQPRDDDGNELPTPDMVKAIRVMAALQGPQGGASEILRAAAEAHQIAGEGFLIGSPVPDAESQLAWEFVSVMELETDSQGTVTRKPKSTTKANDPEAVVSADAYIARYHRPHPAHSADATSAMQRVQSVCREIVLLTQLIDATIKSSIPAGLFFVPSEMSFPRSSEEEEATDDPDEQLDNFQELLIEHMSTPIQDRQSAASVVPLLVSGPADLKDKLGPIAVSDTKANLGWVMELRNDALGNLGTGLEVPPEIMSGKKGLSHWTGANIDIDFMMKHVIPVGDRLTRFLEAAYLRQMLIEFEDMTEVQAARWGLEFDPSEMMSRSDSAVVAKELYAQRLISNDAYVAAGGFDPDQVRPSMEEWQRRTVAEIIMAKGLWQLLPALGVDLEAMGVPAEVIAKLFRDPNEMPGDDQSSTPSERGLPAPVDVVPPGGSEVPLEPAEMAVIVERIRATAEMTLERALEKAAGQLLSLLPKQSLLTKDQVRRTSKIDLLRLIPDGDWTQMRVTPEKLVSGHWDDFMRRTAEELTVVHLAGGLDPLSADEVARRQASDLVAHCKALALAAFAGPLPKRPVTTEVVAALTRQVMIP